MIYLFFAGGLRVSELIRLRVDDVTFQTNASILVYGKGRRERCLLLCKKRNGPAGMVSQEAGLSA